MAAPDASPLNRAQCAALAASLEPLQNSSAFHGSNTAIQPFLAWLMAMLQPRRYVYLGSGDCHGYFTLCRAARRMALAPQAYAVDEWQDDAHFGEISGQHDAAFAGWSCLMRMPWRDALPHFSQESIDLLCIEANKPGEAQAIFRAWESRLLQSAVVVLVGDKDAPGNASAHAKTPLTPIDGIQLFTAGTTPPDAFQEWVRECEDIDARNAWQRWFDGLGSRLADAQRMHQRIAALSHEIGLRDQRIIGLENALGGGHEQHLDQLEAAIAHERGQHAAWDEQFSNVLSSKSWRLTRPLRALMQRMRDRQHARGVVGAYDENASGTAPAGPPPDRNDYAEWVRRYDTPGRPPRMPAQAVTGDNPFTLFPQGHTAAPNGTAWLQGLAEAIENCRSEWFVLVDPQGELAPDALQHLEIAVRKTPAALALYADSDYLGPDGRHTPQFRCAWNPALFLAQDYWGPVRAFRTEALRDAMQAKLADATESQSTTGDDPSLIAAVLSDLTLRVIEKAQGRNIVHIPRVLFHQHEAQYSGITGAQRIALHRDLVQQHLARSGVAAKAEADAHGVRVRYALPAEPPLASLIIPTRNAVDLMRQCIDSILTKTTYPNYEIIIVDNGSDDAEALNYFKAVQTNPRIRVLRDDSPFNYSALNNQAAAIARGEILVLVNNDIEVISNDWLEEMIGHALQPTVGAVGARLWYPDDTLQHGGVILGIRGVAAHAYGRLTRDEGGYMGRARLTQNFTAVTAACLAVRKATYDALGGLNERDLTVAFNDIDFCLRLAAAGYRNVWTPHAELYHHESVSRGTEDNPQKRARFAAEVHYMKVRWGTTLHFDPAYSPNLTLEDNDFSLAWPPRT